MGQKRLRTLTNDYLVMNEARTTSNKPKPPPQIKQNQKKQPDNRQ